MVCPVQYYVVCYTVDGLDSSMRCFCEIEMGKIFESLPKLRLDIIPSRNMVRVAEDINVGMQSL